MVLWNLWEDGSVGAEHSLLAGREDFGDGEAVAVTFLESLGSAYLTAEDGLPHLELLEVVGERSEASVCEHFGLESPLVVQVVHLNSGVVSYHHSSIEGMLILSPPSWLRTVPQGRLER